MVKSLGIDPGTKTFDFVLINNNHIEWEKSIPTHKIAKNPSLILNAITEAGNYDIIVGPSGYGSPVICNEDIIDPWTYALEILLLTPLEQLKKGVKAGDPGIQVYKALAETVKALWMKNEPVCYIPSVILLDTVPLKHKINKIDLGTADKMAATILGIYYASRLSGKRFNEINLVYIESGYGYNAIIRVEKGRIVEGYGGTLMEQGFLTAGPLDLEVVVMGGCWDRTDVFHGGTATACNTLKLEDIHQSMKTNELCKASFERMIDNIKEKTILFNQFYENDFYILSGRNMRYQWFKNKIIENIGTQGKIIANIGLEKNSKSKEAAQGYAIIGEGLKKGYFRNLIEHTRVDKAKGTVLDYITHPRLKTAIQKHYQAYKKSIKKEKIEEILINRETNIF